MDEESYLRFDGDHKYQYPHNYPKRNELADDTQTHILHKR